MITHGYSTSTSSSFAVTLRFDLATPAGKSAYGALHADEDATPGGGYTLQSTTELEAEADTEHFSFYTAGGRNWVKATGEEETKDAQGEHQKFWGKQSDDQSPNWLGSALGEDELHSSAELVSRRENGEVAGYSAVIKVMAAPATGFAQVSCARGGLQRAVDCISTRRRKATRPACRSRRASATTRTRSPPTSRWG